MFGRILVIVCGLAFFTLKYFKNEEEEGNDIAEWHREFIQELMLSSDIQYMLKTLKSMNRHDLLDEVCQVFFRMSRNTYLAEQNGLSDEDIWEMNQNLLDRSDAMAEARELCFGD